MGVRGSTGTGCSAIPALLSALIYGHCGEDPIRANRQLAEVLTVGSCQPGRRLLRRITM